VKFALTVAGFDPTGGAGILRDVLTFKELGFYGCAVITANTAQNTKGVKEVVFQDESLIAEQITLLEEEIEFSGVFADLHTIVYQDIMQGGGFGIAEARPSIELVYRIRNIQPVGFNDRVHPLAEVKLNAK